MSKSTAFRAASIDVCTDYGIATINAYILNSSNSTVTSGSWACSAHGGSFSAVPGGSNYTLRVEAVASGGSVTWRGEVTGVSVVTGQTTNAGQITMIYIGNDTTPPTVSSTSPSNNATSVPINSSVTATFSESMASSTINTTNFTLTQGTTSISGAVSYDPSTKTATFTPTSPLSYATTYTATFTTGVKDMAGNNLQSAYTWSFTTTSSSPQGSAALTGHVRDSGGAGVSGVRVNAYCSSCSDSISGNTSTAADGSYSLPLLPGTYSVSISKDIFSGTPPDYSFSTISINVSGATVQDFTLPALVTLSGKVSDANGVGVSGASIQVGDWAFNGNSITTGSDGTYTMSLYAGTYDITISYGGTTYTAATGVSITANTTRDFTLFAP